MKKGMIIGALIGGLLTGATYICLGFLKDETGMICLIPGVVLLPLDYLFPKSMLDNDFLSFVYSLLFYTVAGGFAGWVFVKCKSKK